MSNECSVYGLSAKQARLLVGVLVLLLGLASMSLGYTLYLNSEQKSTIRSASNKVTSSTLINSLGSLSNSYLYLAGDMVITHRDINTIMRQADLIEAQAVILSMLEPEQDELWDSFALFSWDVYSLMYRIDQEVYSVGVVPKDSMSLTGEQVELFSEMKEITSDITLSITSLRVTGGGYNETAVSELSKLLSDYHELAEEGYQAFGLE